MDYWHISLVNRDFYVPAYICCSCTRADVGYAHANRVYAPDWLS
jgi:hypothetical protein